MANYSSEWERDAIAEDGKKGKRRKSREEKNEKRFAIRTSFAVEIVIRIAPHELEFYYPFKWQLKLVPVSVSARISSSEWNRCLPVHIVFELNRNRKQKCRQKTH